MDKVPSFPTNKHVPQFQNSTQDRKLHRIVERGVIHDRIDEGELFEFDQVANERHEMVDGHLASPEGYRTNTASHLLETP